MATQFRPYAKKKDGIRFHRGLPDHSHLTKWFGPVRRGVLVLDDFMEEGGQDQRVLDLFTKDSDHRNITVLYLTQDLFPPGKFYKTINRNAHYIVARPPEHVPSLPPPPYPHRPPADHDPSLPPGHVPLPPHPPVDVQEQGHRPPRRP